MTDKGESHQPFTAACHDSPSTSAIRSQDCQGGRRVGQKVLSRRQALGKVSKGAAAVGVAAWVMPEILVARPTVAGAMSNPPSGGSAAGGGPGANGGQQAGPTSSGGGAGTPSATVAQSSGAAGAPGGAGAASPTTAGSASSGTLPFTGLNAIQDAEIGVGMIACGWILKRWASRTTAAASEGTEGVGDTGLFG
jgi:hypothetical protein